MKEYTINVANASNIIRDKQLSDKVGILTHGDIVKELVSSSLNGMSHPNPAEVGYSIFIDVLYAMAHKGETFPDLILKTQLVPCIRNIQSEFSNFLSLGKKISWDVPLHLEGVKHIRVTVFDEDDK